MDILTAAEMAAADQRTVEGGISIDRLMASAGEAVARFCMRRYPDARQAMVICGTGNNGGDGMVAARVLAGEGVGVRVLLTGPQEKVKGEAANAMAELEEATGPGVIEAMSEGDTGDADNLAEYLDEADLIIDAVVGTGFKPPLRGLALKVRDALRKTRTPVVAVDLPSGWDADSQEETVDDAFRADAVVTFTAPKMAHIFGHLTADVFGPVVVAEIGSQFIDGAVVSESGLRWAGAAKAMTERPRPINSNKGKFGHVLVVGGSFGTLGAPSMASLSCLRAGAGLVTAAVPRELVPQVGAVAVELMVRSLRQGPEGSASLANLDELEELLKGIKVIALGPGLSTRGEAGEFARGLVAKTKLPIVIDADGLNAFDAERAKDLNGGERTMVLTPHPGEMARLLGVTVPEVEKDRIGIARRFATEHKLTLVLKGWRTLIAHPDGTVAVNTTGNPGLAKGGSGDILTGIVAALLAQYPDKVAEAVEAAVYLHGLAADLAVQEIDENALLATDAIEHLSAAFRYRNCDVEPLTGSVYWLCGVREDA